MVRHDIFNDLCNLNENLCSSKFLSNIPLLMELNFTGLHLFIDKLNFDGDANIDSTR